MASVIEWQTNVKGKEIEPFNHFLKRTSPPAHILRKDLAVPHSRVFVLDNFLTAQECEYYVKQSERLGYQSLAKEFKTDYRNNQRCTSPSPSLAKELWQRVCPLLGRGDIEDVRPYGFGNDGTWKPTGLDPWFKFSKYLPGTFFKPHLDSAYVKSDGERSIFTLMIFLNEDFEGGATNFFNPDYSKGYHDIRESDAIAVVKPLLGRAIVFNHDTLHEGSAVTKGVKYIMRTEIVFTRTNQVLDNSWKNDPNYLKALELYKQSEQHEKNGNISASSDCYLQAVYLQAQQSSIPTPSHDDDAWLIYDVAMMVFGKLGIAPLCKAMLVRKSWCKFARDSFLWKKLYQQHYPSSFPMENMDSEEPFIKDWYQLYANRYVVEKHFKTVCIDMGQHHVKYTVLGSDIVNKPVPTITALEEALHYSVTGVSEDEQYRCGDEVYAASSTSHVVRPIVDGHIIDWGSITHVWKWIFKVGFGLEGQHARQISGTLAGSIERSYTDDRYAHKALNPPEHPVLIAEPLGGYTNAEKDTIKDIMFKELAVPYLCFADSAVLALLASKRVTKRQFFPVAGKHILETLVKEAGLKIAYLKNKEEPFKMMAKCYVASDYNTELKAAPMPTKPQYNLSKGDWMGRLAFKAPELMFSLHDPSIVKFTYDTIMSVSDTAVRDKVWSHVILSGGNTMTKGFAARFEAEMKQLKPDFKLIPTGTHYDVVNGAAIYASMANFRSSCIKNPGGKALPTVQVKPQTEEQGYGWDNYPCVEDDENFPYV